MSAKTIVITGTASGFGYLSVRRFAESGWNVVGTVRKQADLEVHADAENVKTLLLDVDDEEADLALGELAWIGYLYSQSRRRLKSSPLQVGHAEDTRVGEECPHLHTTPPSSKIPQHPGRWNQQHPHPE